MIDEAIDSELEARLRATYREMVPKLVDGPAHTEPWIDDRAELVVSGVPRQLPPRRGVVAACLLVAAAIVGLVVVAQRDRDQATPTDVSTDITTPGDGAPLWYQTMRPLIPDDFEYASLVTREPNEIRVVAVEARDGTALEITIERSESPESQPTTTVDDVGGWTWLPNRGWQVRAAKTGLIIGITCDIGARIRDVPDTADHCGMASSGDAGVNVHSVVEAFATHLDSTLFETEIGLPTDHDVNPAAVTAMIGDAIPDQSPIADTDWGHGDRVFDFSIEGQFPDTSVRVLQNLYPRPQLTAQPGYFLYGDTAAFWMFGSDGVAVRITSTVSSPDHLARLRQLGTRLLAIEDIIIRPNEPAPSTIDPSNSMGTPPLTTIIVETTTTFEPVTVDPHLLPTAMPAGFDDVADGYTVDTEGADAGPPDQQIRLFAGPGEQPAVVMVFTSPTGDVNGGMPDGSSDMTVGSWPSYGFKAVRASGRGDWLRTGGLTAEQVQTVSDAVGQVDLGDDSPLTLPFDLTEVQWVHEPAKAHDITWSGAAGQQIIMSVELWQGVNALANGITWPIHAVEGSSGRIFTSVDATDESFVQVSLVIDGQVINFEASNVPLDDVVAMAESIVMANDTDWAQRVPAGL